MNRAAQRRTRLLAQGWRRIDLYLSADDMDVLDRIMQAHRIRTLQDAITMLINQAGKGVSHD